MADLPLSAAVLLVLRGLAGPWEAPGSEEPPAEREARLETISEAVATVAQDGAPGWRWGSTELAAALVATSYPESQRYLRAVHSGARLGDCKPGRPCQAACLNQVHQQLAISRAEWLASVGTDLQATTLCMRLGARVLGQSARCVAAGAELDAYQVARLVTMYATGKRCRPIRLGWERGRHWWIIDRRLDELLEPTRSAVALM